MVAWGLGGETEDWLGRDTWGMWGRTEIPAFDCGGGYMDYKFVKRHHRVPLKWVPFIACKLYFNKADFKITCGMTLNVFKSFSVCILSLLLTSSKQSTPVWLLHGSGTLGSPHSGDERLPGPGNGLG